MEKDLILRAQNGDHNAFGELYDFYKLDMYRFAYYYLGNSQDAQDAVSDCVLQAFMSIKSLKKPAAFKSWLFKILYFTCSDYINIQSKNKYNVDFENSNLSFTENFSVIENRTALSKALEVLSKDEKTIVLLSAVSGYNSKEIGKMLDLVSSTVRSKYHRALKKLKSKLHEEVQL